MRRFAPTGHQPVASLRSALGSPERVVGCGRNKRPSRAEYAPKSNDGADASLTLHIGSGSVLVTNESQLIRIVDTCGTFQAPWVRAMRQLDDLPEGPPWGDGARELATKFRRDA